MFVYLVVTLYVNQLYYILLLLFECFIFDLSMNAETSVNTQKKIT